MAKKKKKNWQQRVWIGISIVSILALVLFTVLPFLSAGTSYGGGGGAATHSPL